MIRHAWSVLCEKSVVDQATNNISLDVLEQYNIEGLQLPAEAGGIVVPARIELVSLWYRENPDNPVRGQARARFISPDGDDIALINIEIDLTQHIRSRSICRLPGLPIPRAQAGFYNFVVELEENGVWTELAIIPIEIRINPVEREAV